MAERIEFDIRTPTSDADLCENIRHAMSLGLPEVRDLDFPRREALHIVANGPSARSLPRKVDGHTMAINGALKLFEDAPPTYWAACDPQALVADFLTGPLPPSTIYLVASKCHPHVFLALLARGCNIALWHVFEPSTARYTLEHGICPGVSITNCAPELGVRLGYREFHTWGWDGCYGRNGESHAVPQSDEMTPQTIEVDGVQYSSTTTWGLEAQDACARLVGFPYPLHIHGDGMFGHLLEFLIPNRVRRDAPGAAQ